MDILTFWKSVAGLHTVAFVLSGLYLSLRSQHKKLAQDLTQKIQSVENMALLTTSTLGNRIETAKSDVQSVASTMQGVLSSVHDIATSVQSTQGHIAKIATSVDDTVSAISSVTPNL